MITTLAIFLTVALLPILSPGPALFLTVSNTLAHGTKGGFVSAIANGFAVASIGTAVGLALANPIAKHPDLLTSLQGYGAIYLFYLGSKIVHEKPVIPGYDFVKPKVPFSQIFRDAALLGAVNPVVIVFFSASLPLFFEPSRPIQPQVVTMAFGYGLVSASYQIFVAWCIGSMFCDSGRARTAAVFLRRATGGLFLGLSVFLLGRIAFSGFAHV